LQEKKATGCRRIKEKKRKKKSGGVQERQGWSSKREEKDQRALGLKSEFKWKKKGQIWKSKSKE
jgi:hypothetical protein